MESIKWHEDNDRPLFTLEEVDTRKEANILTRKIKAAEILLEPESK